MYLLTCVVGALRFLCFSLSINGSWLRGNRAERIKMLKVRLVVIFIAVCLGLGRAAFSPSVNQQIVSACEQINKGCPQVCDEMTRLDSVTPGNMKITYNYTVTADLTKIPPAKLKEAMDAVKAEVTGNLRTNSDTKQLLKSGVTMCYRYLDQSGKVLTEFAVTP
jgi:hypothetical protein